MQIIIESEQYIKLRLFVAARAILKFKFFTAFAQTYNTAIIQSVIESQTYNIVIVQSVIESQTYNTAIIQSVIECFDYIHNGETRVPHFRPLQPCELIMINNHCKSTMISRTVMLMSTTTYHLPGPPKVVSQMAWP